jgi:hypothetical protein
MHTTTQKLMLQGGLILLGALVVSSIGGWARRATADDQPAPLTAPALIGELRSLEQALEATRGELAVARLQLERANAIIDYSTHYAIAADLAAAIYDVALAEGVDPALAFRLVKVESGFNPNARSKVGAIGYTQVLPSTARLYEPGLTGTCWSAMKGTPTRNCASHCWPTTADRAGSRSCWTPARTRRTATPQLS